MKQLKIGKTKLCILFHMLIFKAENKYTNFFKIYFTAFTFTYMCIHCLGHLPPPPAAGQNLFHSLTLQFC
jgi:hypothetical protein